MFRARHAGPIAWIILAAVGGAQTSVHNVDGPLTLTRAIELARLYNPNLEAARGDVAASSAAVRSARSALAPQVSLNSFATSASYGTIVGSSPGVMPPYWITLPSRGFLDQNVSVMVPLSTGGRLQAGLGSAKWEQRAAVGDLAEKASEVSLLVTGAYLRSLLSQQLTSVQLAKVDAATEMLRTTQAQFDAGKGIEASVLRVKAELARAVRGLATAKNNSAKALLDLDSAVGIPFTSSINLTDALVLAPNPELLDSYVAKALEARGKLIAARARIEASASTVLASERQRAPQLYGQAMGDAGSSKGSTGAAVGLTLSIPIFDGGRISSDVSAAKARRAKAEAELWMAKREVENEIRQAYLDVQTAESNAASALSSVAAQQAAYDVVALRVTAGKSILVEQLDALGALTEAKADLAQAVYDQRMALAKLAQSAGELN